MAFIEIPVNSNSYDYKFTIELDSIVYSMRFIYNVRSERWVMSISTSEEDPIVEGIPVVVSWPLLKRFKDSRLPAGDLFAWDTSGRGIDPNDLNFGSTVLLIYKEAV